jgi:hypothetical protein
MAGPVVNLAARRRRAFLLTAIAGALMTAWLSARALALHDTAQLSGWILFGTLLFLASELCLGCSGSDFVAGTAGGFVKVGFGK